MIVILKSRFEITGINFEEQLYDAAAVISLMYGLTLFRPFKQVNSLVREEWNQNPAKIRPSVPIAFYYGDANVSALRVSGKIIQRANDMLFLPG